MGKWLPGVGDNNMDELLKGMRDLIGLMKMSKEWIMLVIVQLSKFTKNH